MPLNKETKPKHSKFEMHSYNLILKKQKIFMTPTNNSWTVTCPQTVNLSIG